MQKGLEEFQGREAIFLDANIFLYHAFDTNTVAVAFLERVEYKAFKAFTSSLVLEEVCFKLLMQSASNFVSKITVQAIKKALRDENRRRAILQPVVQYVDFLQLLRDSGLVILDVKGQDIRRAVHTSLASGLITADAVHLAVMERNNIRHLATADSDFNAVPDVTVWSPG